MRLDSLRLINFRNYQKFNIEFSPLTIFIGANGIGKTNLIEAIYLLSTSTSYRTHDNKNLVKWDEKFAKISSQFTTDEKSPASLELRIVLGGGADNAKKEVYKDDQKIELKALLGNLRAVLFSPEIINLFIDSPGARRRMLNILASQINAQYIDKLVSLQKVLRQKSRLLFLVREGRSEPAELDFWDEKLFNLNHEIITQRTEIIDFFNSKISHYYQQIGAHQDNLTVVYRPKIPLGEDVNAFISRTRGLEINSASTIYGPHRDEISFLINGRAIGGLVSRGELKTIVLAWKFTEIDYFVSKIGCKPILLLDDIFSELDATRRSALMELANQGQTIVTTTDLTYFKKSFDSANIIDLKSPKE